MSTIFLYLDESGDLGFKLENKGTATYFVITVLVCFSQETRDKINNAVKRTLRKINHRKKKRLVEEFKGYGTVISAKKYFFQRMPTEGWEIYSVVLDKRGVRPHLVTTQGKHKLYNYIARFIIDKINFPEFPKNVNLIVDRSKDTTEIKEFNSYIKNYLQTKLPFNTYLDINHEDSKKSPGVQAVDVFCWGIARKYEKNDSVWYREFRDKIAFETEYLLNETK